ncbi:hypothetical protein [Streptomyces sp. NPDC046805]|uniref:hypothetical protein n=1 Tax=Streptomyces sp. NPDC046805 TaxID=3155134 RepID=UPI0033CB6917
MPPLDGLPLDAAFDPVAMATRRIRDLLPLYRDTPGGEFHLGGDNLAMGYRDLLLSCRATPRIRR